MTGHDQSRRVMKCIKDKFFMQMLKELNRGDALLELLLINREEQVEDVKADGSLGCTDCRMVKSKILKEVREASNRIVILVFRRAAFIWELVQGISRLGTR